MTGISIALATYNGSRFLQDQLESLARQTRLPAELVVTDDASTDETVALVEGFAQVAPFPVQLHRNERRLGYRANFMQAVGLCSGELVAFCDQDDVWEAKKLEVMAELFRDPEVLLAYHDATVVDEGGRVRGRLYKAGSRLRVWEPLTLDPWALVVGFAQVFRRSLVEHAHLQPHSVDPYWPDEPLAHDQFFLFLASVLGRIVRSPHRLVRYRQHEDARFGWAGHSRREHPSRFLVPGEAFVRAAENRLELLYRLDTASRARVEAARVRYREVFEGLRRRRGVFSAPGPSERVRAVGGLVRDGAYRCRRGSAGFGWQELLVDVFVGIPLGPRVRNRLEVP